jgi:hypothetical protein
MNHEHDLTISIKTLEPAVITEGTLVNLEAQPSDWNPERNAVHWEVKDWYGKDVGQLVPFEGEPLRMRWDSTGVPSSSYTVRVKLADRADPERKALKAGGREVADERSITVAPRPVSPEVSQAVNLRRTEVTRTTDQALWVVIRNSTKAISFNSYQSFIDSVMGTGKLKPGDDPRGVQQRRSTPFPGVDAYQLLKVATEVFLMAHAGVVIDFHRFVTYDLLEEGTRFGQPLHGGEVERLWAAYLTKVNGPTGKGRNVATLPYLALIRKKLKDVPIRHEEDADATDSFGILQQKLAHPCLLELIWSYWHEEGMLVQTLNAINLRFQNRRGPAEVDPLAHLELDPLRGLNNLLWGYIQDEQHRLTVPRRAYEYDHHYGLNLLGKAVPELRPADSRSKFLEAFHNLLQLTAAFFKEDDDTTFIADGFPVLNGLKEVHLLLSQGAHNQYGDLPWTARQEMLMQEWLLARPEMREFLPTRVMVAYPEAWMDRVDAMKKLQGWTDVSVLSFRDLGVFGEQILLGIRFGAWSDVNDPATAANWARYWRPEIQGYIHSYRTVTGVDLAGPPPDARLAAERYYQPSFHLRNRLAAQRRPVPALPAPDGVPLPAAAAPSRDGMHQPAAPSRDGQVLPSADGRVPPARPAARAEQPRG